MIKRATKEEESLIKDVIRVLPDDDIHGIRNIFVEETLTDEFGNPISGRYEIRKKGQAPDIYLNGSYLLGRAGKKTIAHEVAHHIYTSKFSKENRAKWHKYSADFAGERISIVAYNNEEDHFSECYSFYHFDRAILKRKEPGAFEYLEEFYGN